MALSNRWVGSDLGSGWSCPDSSPNSTLILYFEENLACVAKMTIFHERLEIQTRHNTSHYQEHQKLQELELLVLILTAKERQLTQRRTYFNEDKEQKHKKTAKMIKIHQKRNNVSQTSIMRNVVMLMIQ